jgi:hypothetical protein
MASKASGMRNSHIFLRRGGVFCTKLIIFDLPESRVTLANFNGLYGKIEIEEGGNDKRRSPAVYPSDWLYCARMEIKLISIRKFSGGFFQFLDRFSVSASYLVGRHR